MEISEDELRAMIRGAIVRHIGENASRPPAGLVPALHASHGLFPLPRGGDGDGACLIEPSVRCNHCGYCLSYGH